MEGLDFTKLPEGQGLIEPGHLSVDSQVRMSGSIYVMSDDCTGIGQYYPIIATYLHVDQMQIESVEAKINLSECAAMETSFSLEKIAEEIGGDEYTLDFNDLQMNLDITSALPFEMDLCGVAQAFADGSSDPVWNAGINIPDIPASSDNQDVVYSYVCELTDFPFSPLPDRVELRVAPADTDMAPIVIRPGTTYGLGAAYSLTADSFGRDFCIRVDDDINGLGLEISEVEVAEAQIKFTLVNALPFNFALAAQAIDEEGNVLDNITLEMEGNVKGGSMQSPAKNPITLKFSSKGHLSLDGVHLVMTTTVSGESALLNKDQYIQLTDISVCLPKGVTCNFSSDN